VALPKRRGAARFDQSQHRLNWVVLIRRKEMKKLLAVLMAMAFALSCASFVAAADTMAGDQPTKSTKKKKKVVKKKTTKKTPAGSASSSTVK
jgi:hypothetical protein